MTKPNLDISNVEFQDTKKKLIFQIVVDYTRRRINDAPPYQRPDNASLEWKQELVRSILSGFPINSIYLRKIPKAHPHYTIEIVDGGHRIRVLVEFYTNKLKTPHGCFINGKDVSNMTYKQLEDKYGDEFMRELFDERELSINYVIGDDISIANVFKLVNNGNDLSRQEVRQASKAKIADEIRSISHQSIDDNGNIVPKWHRVFNVTDFKIGRWDYGHVTAQCSQYELNTDKPNLTSDALDTLYLDSNYLDEFPTIKRVNKIYNNMIPVLQHRQLTYKKGFFVNLYMIVSWLERNKYKIVDHLKFMEKYEQDEEKRRNTKPIGAAKSLYNNATKEFTWKFVIERLEYILSDFCNVELDEYGVIQLDSKRAFSTQEKRLRYNKVDGKCEKCTATITRLDMAEADHIVPYTDGGKTSMDNLQILCRSCNRQKSSKPEMELVS